MQLSNLAQGLLALSCLSFPSSVWAVPSHLVETLPASSLLKRTTDDCHGPTNRACWNRNFNIKTDYDEKSPNTGVVREYVFNITEHDDYIGPDGVPREKMYLINGQWPGPTLRANWGDTFKVTVINNLSSGNGTSLHWHGVRQFHNAHQDGAPGITECPTPPGGNTTVYTWRATQYGTSWYHSHFGAQYAYGVMGSIVIDGPASLPYDIDLGEFPISDWYYASPDKLLQRASDPRNPFVPDIPGASPPSDNVFFNGTNINPKGPGGAYARVSLTPGKRHRLRLINPSVENMFTVSIVGHKMTVIATDFVPVEAYTTDSLFLTVGQRYDITIDADKDIGNYWINATTPNNGVCGASNNPFPAAILSYKGASNSSLPTDRGKSPRDHRCSDEVDFKPILRREAPLGNFKGGNESTLEVDFAITANFTQVHWVVNQSIIDVPWEKPVLQYVREGNLSFPVQQNIVQVPENNLWSIWLITNPKPVPHPMHLHGHDFLFMGRSEAVAAPLDPENKPIDFDWQRDHHKLKTRNPMRRDTAMLPAFGWMVVAFKTDNPGAWLFHCHIAWHASQGLSVDFLVKPKEIVKILDLNAMEPNCKKWASYFPHAPPRLDSGV